MQGVVLERLLLFDRSEPDLIVDYYLSGLKHLMDMSFGIRLLFNIAKTEMLYQFLIVPGCHAEALRDPRLWMRSFRWSSASRSCTITFF